MDQRFVAGIGNIYALEALYRVRLHPATPCVAVKAAAWDALAQAIPPLLELAVEHGGSTISTYRRLNGGEGNFQSLHLVYGRKGERCLAPYCRGTIVRIVQGGRSSFLCPACQPAPRAQTLRSTGKASAKSSAPRRPLSEPSHTPEQKV